MEVIFGHAMATGMFALRSSEALGVNQADSVAAKAEGTAFNNGCEEKTNTKVGEGSKATEVLATFGVGGKRKRGTFIKDEMLCSPTCQTQ